MNNKIKSEQIEFFLKLTGLIALIIGIVLGFANLRGWLKDADKQAVLQWITTSSQGLSIKHPGVVKFMEKFPPPKDSQFDEITHLTKLVMKIENGPIQNASVNYMYRDGTRTTYVATFPEVKDWASQTDYPFWSWLLSLIGFVEFSGGFIIEQVNKKQKAKQQVPGMESVDILDQQ